MADIEDRAEELFRVAYRVGFRLAGQREEAEDIAAETVARAFARWRTVGGYPEAWVARVAANLALDHLRRSRRRPRSAAREVTGGLEAERVDLVAALRKLPRRQREVVVLRYVADLPENDVAARLGCSVGTVKTHASRGLTALRAVGLTAGGVDA